MADVAFPVQEIYQTNPPVGGSYVQNIKNMKGGAGEVVKWNQEGFFIGNENFSNAPFRVDYTGKMVATDGTFTGSISSSTITGGTIQTASSGSRVLMTSGNKIYFNIDGTTYASMYTYTSGNYGMIIDLVSSGEFKVIDNGSDTVIVAAKFNAYDSGIKFNNNKKFFTDGSSDKIITDANFNPTSNDTYSLGDSGHKWHTLWSKILNTGDIVFSDTHCPLCKKELKKGDGLINYLYKQNKEPELQNYTVPAHIECYLKKSKNNSSDSI